MRRPPVLIKEVVAVTAPEGSSPERRRRTHQPSKKKVRRRRRRRHIALGLGVGALVLLGLGVWFGVTAYQAKGELEAARGHAQAARTAVLAGDPGSAGAEARLAANAAGQARSHTSGLPWVLASHVPVVGSTVQATRQIAQAVDDLAQQVLLPAAGVAQVLDPTRLRPAGGTLDIAALAGARPTLDQASRAAADVAARVDAIPATSTVAAVEDARVQLRAQTRDLATLLQNTDTAATLLPTMLGGTGPRSYFVAFQTNAEARGTGGLVGAFGVLRANQGAVNLDDRSSNLGLQDAVPPPVDLGADFDALYGRYNSAGVWINSNLSPNFPYAAQIWTALWQRQSRETLDGAIATDPVALGYLLGATGPVTLPTGDVVSADNVMALTESGVYARFSQDTPSGNAGRKAYLQSISTAVLGAVISGQGGSTTALISALGRAAGEGRLAVWSAHPEEQAVLAGTPLAHEVPDDAAPYAAVTVNNSSNGKLDYYLGRTMSYSADTCDLTTRSATVTATLTNGAPPSGLPGYVTIQGDGGRPGPVGTNRSFVALAATQGAQLAGVSINGTAVTAAVGTERGHPVFTVDVQLPPGGQAVVTWDLVEPTAGGAARVPVQPLVQPAVVRQSVPDCSAS